jgi:hypothetical protein
MDSANKDLSHSLNKLSNRFCSKSGFNLLILTLYQDRICPECKNDHSFRGNFEDTITSIDMLPEIFPEIFKSNSSININKLQEFVN